MGTRFSQQKRTHESTADDPYSRIRLIDGQHPFKEKVPGGYVEYNVRTRPHAEVAYFNFDLAREMGIIPSDHPDKLTPSLRLTLIETFSLCIINEYDILVGRKFDPREIKPNRFMATRYLQLQHPSRIGKTSGDGRSIWNGYVENAGKMWDVTSCGTGATCLSPATAIEKKFFRTGDPSVSYGCGYSDIGDGITNAIFSEIMHRNSIATERTLLVLEYPKGLSINVRTGQNLLRPSHFFNHLKQRRLDRLKAAVDLFMDRQIANGVWPSIKSPKDRYNHLLNYSAETFAKMCAQFEEEYIFCWLDWDGDNILADGGIIDYGSVRQFGLYHHEYRYDDVSRWSTTIPEQKKKARYIVQTYAQMVDFLKTGRRKPISRFSKHPILKYYDQIFSDSKIDFLLNRMGFESTDVEFLSDHKRSLVEEFSKSFRYFETATSQKPYKKVADGITRDILFNVRDVLRELPSRLGPELKPLPHAEFMEILRSKYATQRDLRLTERKTQHIDRLQDFYVQLIHAAARKRGWTANQMLNLVKSRSSVINKFDRVTGDAILEVGEHLRKARKKLGFQKAMDVVRDFIARQTLVPEFVENLSIHSRLRGQKQRTLHSMLRIVRDKRDGI